MGRFAEDAELGFPKYHLKNSNFVLMDKCVIAEQKFTGKTGAYHWINTNVFAIDSQPLLIRPQKIPDNISVLGNIANKIGITFIYSILVLALYFFSVNKPLTYIPGFSLFPIAFGLFFLIVFLLWDYIIFYHFTKNFQLNFVIKLYLSGKKHSILLSGDKPLDSSFFQNFIIIFVRSMLIISAITMDSSLGFQDTIKELFFIMGTLIIMISMFIGFYFILVLIGSFEKYFSNNYEKVESLDIINFHSKLIDEMKYEIENYETPLKELITGKETPDIELKASYWTDAIDKSKNLLLQDAIIKVTAGMLNTNGGHILIGIEDNTTKSTGLIDADIKQLNSEKSWDRLEAHIVTTFENNLLLETGRTILVNRDFILKGKKWPENDDGEMIIHIHVPRKSSCKVYAYQKASQKMKLEKWRESKEGKKFPNNHVPYKFDELFEFRFIRKQTSTKHQSREEWDRYWYIF